MIGDTVIWVGYDGRPRPAIMVQDPPGASHQLLWVIPLDPFDTISAGQPAAALGIAPNGGVAVHQWAAQWDGVGTPAPNTWAKP